MRILLLCLVILATTVAFAQPEPDAPPPVDMRPEKQVQEWIKQLIPLIVAQPPLMASTPTAVYVVRGGVLAKYDPQTLEAGGLVELFGPLPDDGNKANAQANLDKLRRLMPGGMLVTEQNLLIVIGEHFFRVNRATLEVKVNVSLFQDQALAPAERLLAVAAPPALSLNGATLYVTRGSQLLAVNWEDGKVRAIGALPDPFAGKLPAVGKLPVAKNNRPVKPGGQPAQAVVLVGALTLHEDNADNFWTLKVDDGGEYLLSGNVLDKLVGEHNNAGKRLRITGMLTPPGKNDFGKGEVEITKYEILP